METGEQPLHERPGVQVLDWNAARRTMGAPGHEIATLFSLVVGDAGDGHAARFVHCRMDPDGPPRLLHAHPGWTATIVIEGSMTIEDERFDVGQMVLVAPNVAYGPIVPGPEGATFLEIFSGVDATVTLWDEDDPRVEEYRGRGWIVDQAPRQADGSLL
jgi:hypothetical protein